MALTEDFKTPRINQAPVTALPIMCTNWYFLLLCAVNGVRIAPGWTTVVTASGSPLDYAHPDSMVLSKLDATVSPSITRRIRFTYTWTGDNCTTIVCAYDDGSGYVTVTGGTLTLAYDGLGNFTGATSA